MDEGDRAVPPAAQPPRRPKFGTLGGGMGENHSSWGNALTSAMAAANTQGGGSWISMDGETPAQPAYLKPPPVRPQAPAWMNTMANAISSANTGYNPQAPWISIPVSTRPVLEQPTRGHLRPVTQRVSPGDEELVDVMPDGSVVPVDTGPETLPSNPEPIAAPTPPMRTPPAFLDYGYGYQQPRRGFGSSYGGNWGGNTYGYNQPAFFNTDMGLYSWKFGG